MKSSTVALALILGGILGSIVLPSMGPAAAADTKTWSAKTWSAKTWRYTTPGQELPFPRSERAATVWAAGACWSECGAYCAWGQSGCLERDAQGLCLKLTDACDRYCQRQCRSQGGPALPIDFYWE